MTYTDDDLQEVKELTRIIYGKFILKNTPGERKVLIDKRVTTKEEFLNILERMKKYEVFSEEHNILKSHINFFD